MDWTTISSISQIIATLAVIGSLIYLAKEVKNGTKNLRTNMQDSVMHAFMEWSQVIMSDPELAWIFQEGSKNPEVLDEKQRARFVIVAWSFLKGYENVYLHHVNKVIEASMWEHNKTLYLAYITTPGINYYWTHRKMAFDIRFQKFTDDFLNSNKVENISIKPGLFNLANKEE